MTRQAHVWALVGIHRAWSLLVYQTKSTFALYGELHCWCRRTYYLRSQILDGLRQLSLEQFHSFDSAADVSGQVQPAQG